jgi:hypothetical protein
LPIGEPVQQWQVIRFERADKGQQQTDDGGNDEPAFVSGAETGFGPCRWRFVNGIFGHFTKLPPHFTHPVLRRIAATVIACLSPQSQRKQTDEQEQAS